MGANLVFPTEAMAASCKFHSVIMPQAITAANNEENLYFIHLFRANIAIPTTTEQFKVAANCPLVILEDGHLTSRYHQG